MSGAGSARSESPVLRAENVAFGYGKRSVLRGVTLDVQPGEFLALAGPNGAGKTTLLHILTGYLKPDSGLAELDARPVAALPRREVARRLAYVPQRSDFVFPFRVSEVVLMGRQPWAGLAALDTMEDRRKALGALRTVGMAEAAGRRFDELSGGERQLVLIARALAQQAPIMILDEPATFLDLRRQWQVMELLSERQRNGTTVVATFHDLNLAARWAGRLALLHEGNLAALGTPEEVLKPEVLHHVYQLPLIVEPRPSGPPRVELPGPLDR